MGEKPSAPTPSPPRKGAKNVLYIVVDDLRTQLGAYGHTVTSTPNLDKLANASLQFLNAYAQQGELPCVGTF
jgi:arylsulfatase A-like enzyme